MQELLPLLVLIVGAAFGVDRGDMMAFGAAIGGLHGTTSSGSAAAKSQMEIIKNCLSGIEYNILN